MITRKKISLGAKKKQMNCENNNCSHGNKKPQRSCYLSKYYACVCMCMPLEPGAFLHLIAFRNYDLKRFFPLYVPERSHKYGFSFVIGYCCYDIVILNNSY